MTKYPIGIQNFQKLREDGYAIILAKNRLTYTILSA